MGNNHGWWTPSSIVLVMAGENLIGTASIRRPLPSAR